MPDPADAGRASLAPLVGRGTKSTGRLAHTVVLNIMDRWLDLLLRSDLLQAWTPAQLGTLFFVVFWALTLLTMAVSARSMSRRLYLVLFFGCLLLPGLAGKNYWLWPFQTWHLWGGIQPDRGEFYELYVVDAQGRRLLYDRHAIPPVLNTQVHYLARKLLNQPDRPEAQELTAFLLQRAQAYRQRVERPAVSLRFPPFPPRQFGRTWRAEELKAHGPFVGVVARRVGYHIPDQGRAPETSVVTERQFP